MKEKLEYKNDRERANFVIKYQGQNIADDLPNKIIYLLEDNEYLENGVVKINENYEKEQQTKENKIKQLTIFNELEDLDRKRIRALAEPQLKDSSSGQTWLEFYNSQVKVKREELSNL